MLALNVGHAWAQTVTWEKATSIAAGDVVALVCDSKKMELSGISTTSTKYGIGVAYTSTPAGAYVLTVEAGNTSGTYSFKCTNGQYLYWTSGNSLATNATKSANTSWKVTFSGETLTIVNAKDNSRKLQWNASSPRFACYTGSQTAVQLYKKVISEESEDVIVKTLKSIEVTPKTVDYETGDVFKFDGTCTATYSVTKNGEPQDNETAVVTPTTVSTPDMSTAGTKEITVTYTEGDVTVTDKYEINITENVVTPGEYTGNLNNVFFGCSTGNIAAEQSGKFNDVLVVAGCKSNAQTKTSYQAGHVRFYADSYLTISVPAGYVIKSIVFTADGTWNGSITASAGTYTDGTKTWAGNAQEVKFSFAAQNRIKSVKVTYDADVKYALNITTPSNGTLVVKDGSAVLADGAQVYEGTKLVVTPTPNAGYVFESLTVDGTPVDLTEGSYNLTMPAANVTIAATFKANEKPAATLTLSKNGNTEDITGYKQDDKVILPSITSDCVKEFVGWSADANCAIEPEYKAGDEYTLEETAQILYAVYATVGAGGEATAANTLSSNGWTNQSQHKSLQIDENVKAEITGNSLTNSGKYYDSGTNWRLYQNENPNLTISTTLGELKSITFTFTNDKTGTLLYNGATLTSGIAVEVSGTSAIFTVGNSTASVTNGQIRISKIEVVYTGGVSYSDYSTECVEALDEPTFSVAEGTYTEAKSIELNATEGDIYYTLDGTEPTKLSTLYTDDAIVLDECGTTTIKAIAISTESQSPVASATYTINLPITNTAATAYTPAEAIAIIDGECDKTEEVFVKGVVVSTSEFNATYGNYDVIVKAVDDNSATPTTFTFYRMYKAASKTKFTASDEVIGVGDIITAKGVLKKHNSTYELADGCYMVERVAYTEPKTDISNTLETAYTVDKAFELISDIKSDLDKEVYVKGLVAVASTELYEEKYLTYSISDNGQNSGNVLKVYDGLNIDGVAFTSKDDVKVGDYVVVKGKLLNYKGTYEINKDNQLVQHKKAATITVSDITMEEGETKTIAATITPAAAETAVTYTIKENAANAISLSDDNVITANAVGTATITATIETAADYMGKTVDFTVTVTPKSTSDEVVILAELDGKWYAMKGAVPSGKSNQLDAIEVTYFNGTLYNVPDEVKASITWTRSVVDGKATFVNNGKYLKGGTSTDLNLAGTVDNNCKWMWNDENGYYTTNTSGTIRTFLYRVGYNFKNYGASQAGKEDVNGNYSELPVVTAPIYATGNPVYTRNVTNKYGTICLPYASASTSGAYFYRVAGKETGKVYLESVDALEAGVPYIFEKTANTITVTCQGEAVAEAGSANGLVGNFTNEFIVPANNYILYNNAFILADGTTNKVNAYRAYLDMNAIIGGAPQQMPGRRYIGMDVQGENVETGVEDLFTTDAPVKVIENGQLIIIRDGVKYNVQGQKL